MIGWEGTYLYQAHAKPISLFVKSAISFDVMRIAQFLLQYFLLLEINKVSSPQDRLGTESKFMGNGNVSAWAHACYCYST